MRYADKNFEGATFYEYRLQAIDSTGNKSPYSPEVSIRTKPKVSRNKIIGLRSSLDSTRKVIRLDWQKPDSEVQYYVLYRGKDEKRPVSYVSPDGNLLFYEDTFFHSKSKYTYMIKAYYKDGGESPFCVFPVVEVR
jgi:hypothetical protein